MTDIGYEVQYRVAQADLAHARARIERLTTLIIDQQNVNLENEKLKKRIEVLEDELQIANLKLMATT